MILSLIATCGFVCYNLYQEFMGCNNAVIEMEREHEETFMHAFKQRNIHRECRWKWNPSKSTSSVAYVRICSSPLSILVHKYSRHWCKGGCSQMPVSCLQLLRKVISQSFPQIGTHDLLKDWEILEIIRDAALATFYYPFPSASQSTTHFITIIISLTRVPLVG